MKPTDAEVLRFIKFLKDPENKEVLNVLFTDIASLVGAFMRKHNIL